MTANVLACTAMAFVVPCHHGQLRLVCIQRSICAIGRHRDKHTAVGVCKLCECADKAGPGVGQERW